MKLDLPWPPKELTPNAKRRKWSEREIYILRGAYLNAKNSEELDIRDLSIRLSRSPNSIIVKAGRLGLTDIKRLGVAKRKDAPKYATLEERSAGQSAAAKARIARDGHPRHMLGKSHSEQTREVLSEAGVRHWASMTPKQKREHATKAMLAKAASGNPLAGTSPHGSWKAGWREIGGERRFYRSRWEANYARYLQWLVNRGDILDWKYEPETFWFDKIKRGVRSYLPDFRVWENDGTSKLHEVKGWMDARSKTTLRRMAKYHPNEKIVVIRERDYNSIARQLSRLIPGWEESERTGRW